MPPFSSEERRFLHDFAYDRGRSGFPSPSPEDVVRAAQLMEFARNSGESDDDFTGRLGRTISFYQSEGLGRFKQV